MTAMLVGACAHSVPLGAGPALSIKAPAGRLPAVVGIYYSPEFRVHEEKVWKKGDRWDFPLGTSSVRLFDQAIPLVFEKAIPVQGRPPLGAAPDLGAVIEPRIEAFDFQLPWLKTSTYSAEISYRIILYNRAGDSVVSWVVKGAGEKAGQVGFEFARWPGEAADLAMRDAVQKFVDGFAEIPEIKAWLQRTAGRQPGLQPGPE